MSRFPSEIDLTGREEGSARGLKLPSAPYENRMNNQLEEGSLHGAFRNGGSHRIGLETALSCESHGYLTSELAEDQVLAPAQQPAHQLLQLPQLHGSPETEQQDACLLGLEQAMMEETARDSLIFLPSEVAEQSIQVSKYAAIGGDSLLFEDELRKETNRPESGYSSRQHNAIPDIEILHGPEEGTMCDADPLLEGTTDLEIVVKEVSASVIELQAAAGGNDQDLAARNSNAFEKMDSVYLQSTLFKASGRPRSGDPSKGHD